METLTSIPRTQQEILDRIKEVRDHDFMGIEVSDLMHGLLFKTAYEENFLKKAVTSLDWDEVRFKSVEHIRETAINYIDFAWEKANNCRGLSAGRSLSHYRAWLWLMGVDEEWVEDLLNYEYYGKDKLRKICEYLEVDPDKYDDKVRTNTAY